MKKQPKVRKFIRLPAPSTVSPSTALKTLVLFSVNIIVPATADRLACFVAAGSPSPYQSLDEVPQAVRGFVVQPGDERDPEHVDEPQSLTYTLNTSYDVDSRGFRRSRVGREVVNLQQQAETQAYWEERLSESTEQEEAALAIVQADHETGVARDIAAVAYKAKEAEMADQFAREFTEDEQIVDDGRSVSPAIEPRAAT